MVASTTNVPNYTVTTVGTGSIVLSRRFTPTWAIAAAVVGVLFFLVGLLALLVKVNEQLSITLTPVEGGTKISISGLATPELVNRISSAVQSLPALDRASGSEVAPVGAAQEKVCPQCAESVKSAATVCRFCNHEFVS